MQLRRKMVLIVIASIVLTAVPGAALIYHYAQGNIRESKAVELEKTTAASSALAMQRFAQSEPKLAALAHVLQLELAQPIRPGEIEAFHESVERYPDGVWRNRRSGYDGSNEAGMFLPANTEESDAQKILHLRIMRIMDVFGAAASKPLENVWYLSPQRSEVIFDRNLAEFVFEMKADTDYTQTPWLTYTSPQLNPKRQLRFTPPLFDPVPRVWMVSAIYPLYVNGQWLGSLGEDLPLSGVLNSLFAQGQLIHGAQRFLLDREGNFVLAGPWQRQLESNPGAFHSELNRERQLTELMQLPLTDSPHLLNDEVVVQGRRYMAIGARLEPVGWRFYSLTPVDEIIAPTRRLFLAMVGMILLVAAVSGAMIATAVGAGITRRIRMLSDVMKGYTKDHQLRVNEIKIGNDEIAEVALVYNHMADDIDQNIAQRLDAERALTKSEELWRFALEGSGDGVWDMDLINKTVVRTRRWKEMLGYSEEEIGDSFDEWVTRVHPDDLVRVSVDDVRSGANDALTSQYRMRCKDGSYIWILDRSMVVRQDVDGNSTRVVGTIHDISDLKNQAAHIQKLAFYDTLT